MIRSLLLEHLYDPASSWSVGRFGAIAEFHRGEGEAVELAPGPAISAATDRGAIRIDPLPQIRPIAYETISTCIESWGQGVALCLPYDFARMSGRVVVTEVGPDLEAVRPQDREALLFDLGLGGSQADVCVRSADPETIALLRSACGKPMFSPDHELLRWLPELSPHRVFCCRTGRIEVYQPIPAPGGKTPDGPHTHVLPKLLAMGRDQSATVPIPEGWLAGMTLYPAHPLFESCGSPTSFDDVRYEAFQSLMKRYGDPSLMAGKLAALADGMIHGNGLSTRDVRQHALGFRIGQRQLKWLRSRG
jgi:hypothetical protein